MNRRSFSLLTCLVLAAFLNTAVCLDELRFYLRSEPKTFNPLAVADDASETIRYLTGGVLLRLNRDTQKLEPDLASSWHVSKDGKTITFVLRHDIYFSDGTRFTSQDVKYTMDQLMNPELHSPTGDSFRSGSGKVECTVLALDKVAIHFPCSGGRTRQAVRPGRDCLRAVAQEGDGSARSLLCFRLQARIVRLSAQESGTTGSAMRQAVNCLTSTP